MIQWFLCKIGLHGPCSTTGYLLTMEVTCQSCGTIWYEQIR